MANDHKMRVHKEVQEIVFSLRKERLYTILMEDEFLRFICCCFAAVGIFGVFTQNFLIVVVMSLWCSFLLLGLAFGTRPKAEGEENSRLVENLPKKQYMLNIGTQVKKFYGDAVKSGRAKGNKIKPLLLDAETIKRHGVILATTGGGKSVLMKGMIEQIMILGGGGLFIDGKGTAEFAKEIYGIAAAYGREDDFYHINFLDMDNTHTVNPLLSGSAIAIFEILSSLLKGEENEWKAKQKEFMKCILKLLVWKRDYENLKLDFGILAEYLTLAKLVEEALIYRKYAKKYGDIEDFIQFVSGSIALPYDKFLSDTSEEFATHVRKEATNVDLQGVYDASMSAQAWRDPVTNLKSNYGKVFNTQTPDISMWEAVQRNKIIFVTLPTMASDDTPKELGKLILGLIKGVADEKARKAKDPDIPFVCMLDEVGSYIVEGFGRLMSKSRALGISVWLIFQSFAQLDIVGKMLSGQSSERQEAMGMIGTHIIMKCTDPEATKFYQDFAPKRTVMEKAYYEKRDWTKGQMGAEQSFSPKEVPAFEHNDIVAMNNGEMLVLADGVLYKAIAQAENSLQQSGKKITYEGKDIQKPLPITRFMPKKQFFALMSEYKKFREQQNQSQEQKENVA